MEPTLREGDIVLGRTAAPDRGRPARSGDVVCVRMADGTTMIKRLGVRLPNGGYRLSGDGVASAPAIDLGIVPESRIIAQAVLRIGPDGIGLLRTR